MLYWKSRNKKSALGESSSDSSGGGAGSGAFAQVEIDVDQTYKSTSKNAQSGTAVSQAVTQLEQEITTKYGTVLRYKGSKNNYASLPQSGNTIGDVWNVTDTGANYAWDGSKWDKLSEDISGFATKTEVTTLQNALNDHKANKDSNCHHLTSAEYTNFTNIQSYSQSDINTYLNNLLNNYLKNGDFITKNSLTTQLNSLKTEIQTYINNQVTNNLSGNYVSSSDFNNYKNTVTNQCAKFIKCDQADKIEIYTPGNTPAELGKRTDRVIYMVDSA